MLAVRCLRTPFHQGRCGLHTLERIARGQAVWRGMPSIDRAIPNAARAAMTPAMRIMIDALCAPQGDAAQRFADGGAPPLRHSGAPNVDFSQPELGFALRDIEAGEELTVDHSQLAALRESA